MLQAKHITISYGAKTVLKDVSLDFAAGSLTAIIGRNGCGKSTLLKAMSRSLIPQEGDVLLDGTSIFHQNTKKLAQRLEMCIRDRVHIAQIERNVAFFIFHDSSDRMVGSGYNLGRLCSEYRRCSGSNHL